LNVKARSSARAAGKYIFKDLTRRAVSRTDLLDPVYMALK
jgi:hypothetical protein